MAKKVVSQKSGDSSTATSSGKTSELSFTQSLTKLKEIAEKLDRGDLELEESLALYEEGIKLHKACVAKLENAILKFEEVSK